MYQPVLSSLSVWRQVRFTLEKSNIWAIPSFCSVDLNSGRCRHLTPQIQGENLILTKWHQFLSCFFGSFLKLAGHEKSQKIWDSRNNNSIRYIFHWLSHIVPLPIKWHQYGHANNVMRKGYALSHRMHADIAYLGQM